MAITRSQFEHFLVFIQDRYALAPWKKHTGILKNHKIYVKINRLSKDPKYEYDPSTDPYITYVSLETGTIYLSNDYRITFDAIVYSKSIKELKSKFYLVSDL